MNLGKMTSVAVEQAERGASNKPIRSTIREVANTIATTARVATKVAQYVDITLAKELDDLIAEAKLDNRANEQELAQAQGESNA